MSRTSGSLGFVCLTLVGLAAGSGEASAQAMDGVFVGPMQPEPVDSGNSIVGGNSINFDDVPAACLFLELTPLTTEYAAQGVTFGGVGLDGGARINQCGGFGVSGQSEPNFLAFNVDPFAQMTNGGFPRGPETITFAAPVNRVTINAGQSQAGTMTMECFDQGGNSVGTDSLVGTSALQPLSVSAFGITRCVLDFTGAVAVFDDLSWDPTPPCFTLDFETEDDFVTDLVNGQHIDTEFGVLVSITSSGPNAGIGIFDSTPGGPNDPSQDRDLLVDSGNILILQTENFPVDGNDLFPRPNDDEDGGTITFQLNALMEARSVKLIDIDTTDDAHSVVLTDSSARQRTYTVPANWTGDVLVAGPGSGVLDLLTLAPQPGFGSVATATEDAGFDASSLVQIDFDLNGSAGIDDLALCMPAATRASAHQRNGSGTNPMSLTPTSIPIIGRTWTANLDCSAQGPGMALLVVRHSPSAGLMMPFGEVLIQGAMMHQATLPQAGTVRQLTWDIPFALSLIGAEVHAQGLCTGSLAVPGAKRLQARGRLSNAVDLILGF